MFLRYFDLECHPFQLTPDPRFLFLGRRHREAMAHLEYSLQANSGFFVLTGEVGTGKTTLCRSVLARLPAGVEVALIFNPRLTVTELLQTICDELAVACPPASQGNKALFDILNRHLLARLDAGQRTALIIDEAQGLSGELLEQLRLLTNLETHHHKLLQIILIGQPELEGMLRRTELRQLAQRVTAFYRIGPLEERETADYIRHRLAAAGWRGAELFSPAACRWIHRFSRGLPRLINRLCERALLRAYAEHRRTVSWSMAVRAGMECLLPLAPGWVGRPLLSAGLRVVVLLSLVGLGMAMAVGVLPGDRLDLLLAGFQEPSQPLSAPVPTAVPASAPVGKTQAPVEATAVPLPMERLAMPWHDALRQVARLWGETSVPEGDCAALKQGPLACADLTGSWQTLAAINRPAILTLQVPGGGDRFAVLERLTEAGATLATAGERETLSRQEVERLWNGAFFVLWQPPPIQATVLRPWNKGPDVLWLRQRLEQLHGEAIPGNGGEVFDAPLKERLRQFQRQHQLQADGMAGFQTLLVLASTPLDPQGPVLREQPALALLLHGRQQEVTEDGALRRLFTGLGVAPATLPERGLCEHAPRLAMQCDRLSGSWSLLRRLGRPAVLELLGENGKPQYGVLAGFEGEEVRLRVGHREGVFARQEVERLWPGRFTVLWQTLFAQELPLRPGDRGEGVSQVRSRLERRYSLTQPPASDPGLFDEGLSRQVKRFQEEQALRADGVVNVPTLLLLQATETDNIPPTPGRKRG